MVYRPLVGDTASSRSTEQWRMAPWATYTPAWTSSGSAPALGNGTLVAGYRREGTTLHLGGDLVVGSTSTVGTGELRMSLPSGVTAGSARYQVLSAFWYDASAAAVVRAIGIVALSGTYVTFQAADTGTRLASSAVANGDELSWTGTIEIAP